MASQEHLEILTQGVEIWSQWWQEHPDLMRPDVSEANLNSMKVRESFRSSIYP